MDEDDNGKFRPERVKLCQDYSHCDVIRVWQDNTHPDYDEINLIRNLGPCRWSDAEHATSRLQILSTVLNLYKWMAKKQFVSLKPE